MGNGRTHDRRRTDGAGVPAAWIACLAVLACAAAQAAPGAADPGAGPQDPGLASVQADASRPRVAATDAPAMFRVERGGELPLLVPRGEVLSYDVTLSLGILGDPHVGKVTLASRVEPHRSQSPLLLTADPSEVGERAVLSARAEGRYAMYELREEITATHLPEDFPRVIHRQVQTGSENRQRELLMGERDGEQVATYRSDRHCKGCQDRRHFLQPAWAWQDEHHCKRCKRGEHRVWREPETVEIPGGTLDMLSAVWAARTMLLRGEKRVDFPLLDKTDLWHVTLTRGKTSVQEVPAGRFQATEIKLYVTPPPGHERDGDFEGLFGIHGAISIWLDSKTGVPVWIRGLVPAGPFELDVSISLVSHRGTPEGFAPLRKE